MSALMIAPPAEEPATLAEIRDWLRLDTTDEDDVLTSLIAAARLTLEGHTRRAFIAQTWRFTYASTMADGAMRLPLAPLLSVVDLRVYDAAGVATSAAPSQIEIDADDQRPLVRLLDATLRNRAARIEVDASLGYGPHAGDVPAPLRQAMRMLVAGWHARRGDMGPDDALRVPRSVTALVAPYRRARIA